MGVNPSAAPDLHVCTDAQFGKGTREPVACPANSKIGTVAIDTPPLPDGTLTGNVYLGEQLSRDPLSGNVYRVFLAAESAAPRALGAAGRQRHRRPARPASSPPSRRAKPRRCRSTWSGSSSTAATRRR